MTLSNESCTPCQQGGIPLPAEEATELAVHTPLWTLAYPKIEREFTFKDFRDAVAFVNQVADAAEEADHHPDIYISYNHVRLTLWTHKIGGLSRNDFILATKIDALPAAGQNCK